MIEDYNVFPFCDIVMLNIFIFLIALINKHEYTV